MAQKNPTRETRIPEVGIEVVDDVVVPDVAGAMTEDDPLLQALLDAVGTMRRFGGAIAMVPVRRRVAPDTDVFVTTEYALRWYSYAPVVEDAEDADEAFSTVQDGEPLEQPEAEPVAAAA